MRTPAGSFAAAVLTTAFVVASPAAAQFVFEGAERERVGRSPSSLAVADFDEDGFPDAACGDLDDTVSLLRNEFGFALEARLRLSFATPTALLTGDWNEDGHADLGVTSGDQGTLGVFLGDGAGEMTAPAIVPLDLAPWDVIGADLDADGHGDLVVIGVASAVVLWGDGTGAFFPPAPLPVPSDVVADLLAVRAADLDGDGSLDLAFAAFPASLTGAGHALVVTNLGDRDFALRSDFSIPLRWPADLVADDMNTDGRVDLLFTSLIGDSPHLFLGRESDGGVEFDDPAPVLGSFVLYAASHDFDRDGAVDIAATGGYPGEVRLFRGDGSGGFSSEATLRTGAAPRRLVVADFDRDDRADVVTANWRDEAQGTVTPFLNRTLPACRAGSVNRGAGAVTNVLFVNDSAGGSDRTVRITSWEPLVIFMAPPPLAVRPAAFALFAWSGAPEPGEEHAMPHGVGVACRPMLERQSGPRPAFVWNNTSRAALGRSPLPSEPAPFIVLERRAGAGRSMTFFLQGVIEDPGSAGEKPASVTNGVIVEIR